MWVGWRAAMEEALYGASGFYRSTGVAARHFRTSVHASGRFAVAMGSLLGDVDGLLRRPGRLDVVDMGGGDGRLLSDLYAQVPPQLQRRLRLTVVERGQRPADLASNVHWAPEPPDGICGLVVANEWLDNVPVDVVELTTDGPRMVLVDRDSGEERIGGRPRDEDQRWLDRWWPLAEPGDRAEVGRSRDEAWVRLTRRLHRGLAIAIDYGHFRHTRPPFGTLTGYWHGRQVPPVPDGACDITAHVALDACASAAGSRLTTQRAALRALGITGQRPPLPQPASVPAGPPTSVLADLSASVPADPPASAPADRPTSVPADPLGSVPADPPASVPADLPAYGSAGHVEYLRRLSVAAEEAELIDPDGLGGFGWLVHANGIPVPERLRGTING